MEFVREGLRPATARRVAHRLILNFLLRILLIGYLYGITSERKLVEELRMHLAWRWFTGLGFDQEILHHSTFSKNRHGRFPGVETVRAVVRTDREAVRKRGTVAGQTFVGRWKLRGGERGWARSCIPAASSWRRRHNSTARCVRHLADPSSRTRWKGQFTSKTRYRPLIPILLTPPRAATPARLGYYDNYLVDNGVV